MKDIFIQEGYLPGAVGRVVQLHGSYYWENWGFDLFFETKVARELSEFLMRYDKRRDGFWVALEDGKIEGSIAIDGETAGSEGAHLRWFVVSNDLRGSGVGRLLLKRAMDFCDSRGYRSVFLWTFEGLDAARHLYDDFGFKLAKEKMGIQWGKEVKEQCLVRQKPV